MDAFALAQLSYLPIQRLKVSSIPSVVIIIVSAISVGGWYSRVTQSKPLEGKALNCQCFTKRPHEFGYSLLSLFHPFWFYFAYIFLTVQFNLLEFVFAGKEVCLASLSSSLCTSNSGATLPTAFFVADKKKLCSHSWRARSAWIVGTWVSGRSLLPAICLSCWRNVRFLENKLLVSFNYWQIKLPLIRLIVLWTSSDFFASADVFGVWFRGPEKPMCRISASSGLVRTFCC